MSHLVNQPSGSTIEKRKDEMKMSNQLLIQIENKEEYEKVVRFMKEHGINYHSDYVYDFLYETTGVEALECYLNDHNDLNLPEDMKEEISCELAEIFYDHGLINDDRVFELSNQFIDEYLRNHGFDID